MEDGKRWMAAFQLFSSLTRAEMAYKVTVLVVVVAFLVIICLAVMGMVMIVSIVLLVIIQCSHNQYFTVFYFIFTGSWSTCTHFHNGEKSVQRTILLCTGLNLSLKNWRAVFKTSQSPWNRIFNKSSFPRWWLRWDHWPRESFQSWIGGFLVSVICGFCFVVVLIWLIVVLVNTFYFGKKGDKVAKDDNHNHDRFQFQIHLSQ